MERAARESATEGRIVNVSSEGHKFTFKEGIWFDKINENQERWIVARKQRLLVVKIFICNISIIIMVQLHILSHLHHHLPILRSSLLLRCLLSCPLLSEKEDNAQITANSLHAGAVVTNILRHLSFIDVLVTTVGKYVLKNVQQVREHN